MLVSAFCLHELACRDRAPLERHINAGAVQVRRRRMRRPARCKCALPGEIMPNESRLDQLRDQAWEKSSVTGLGVDVAGGPIPRRPGYYGQPVVKPPVWTWEIPVYFFVGGLGGMSAVIASAAVLFHQLDLVRAAMWLAAISGAVLSPILLIMDLGRP